MNYDIKLSDQTVDYLVAVLPYSEESIKEKIREMSFSEYFQMHNAIQLHDSGSIHALFADLTEADNAFSVGSTAAPTTAKANQSTNSTLPSPDEVEAKKDSDDKDGDNKSLYTSTKQKISNLTKQLGNMDSSLEEDDEKELKRIRSLAGVSETCSAGATGAGAVATATSPVSGMQRRENPSIYKNKKTKKTPKKK